MQAVTEAVQSIDFKRYAKCVENSKRMRFDIDRDVIRGRAFDFTQKFLPDGLSKVDRLTFLSEREKRLLSQIQGRSYANIFGLVERFIAAKVLEVSRDHWLGDQTALEALVRFGDEELKHQEMFRRIESMIAAGMPDGYAFLPDPNAVASVVLGKSTWSVLALTCHIELFVLAHYRESIDPDPNLSALWKDVFLYHWREESQHAILDELEWAREDARLGDAGTRSGGERAHRAGRRGRRDPAEPVGVGRGLFPAHLRANVRTRRSGTDPHRCARGVPLAVHRIGRAGAVRRGAWPLHHFGAVRAHRQGARADHELAAACARPSA